MKSKLKAITNEISDFDIKLISFISLANTLPLISKYLLYNIHDIRDLNVWIVLFSIPLFIGNFIILKKISNLTVRILGQAVFSVGFVTLIAVIYVNKPIDWSMTSFSFKAIVINAFTLWFRGKDNCYNYDFSGLSETVRLEWIKEKLSFWKILVIIIASGMIGLLIPYTIHMRNLESHNYSILCFEFFFLCVLVIAGPFRECMNKIFRINGMMLDIKKQV